MKYCNRNLKKSLLDLEMCTYENKITMESKIDKNIKRISVKLN